jgi:sulfur-carrier protein
MIRVILPQHLRTLAQVGQEVELSVEGDQTIYSILNTLILMYPMLRGTIIDQVNGQRRPYIRFFACGEDLSLDPLDSLLPEAVVAGTQPFRIVGAMAGG